jgi:hypothetical protein
MSDDQGLVGQVSMGEIPLIDREVMRAACPALPRRLTVRFRARPPVVSSPPVVSPLVRA